MLPKISFPSFNETIPSLKKEIKMRVMLVKEEKILLMAKETENTSEIFAAIKEVVDNCILSEIDKSRLTVYDLEYLFLKLRSRSVSNMSDVEYKDVEDEQNYQFKINLEDIKVKFPEEVSNVIPIPTAKLALIMRHPPASIYEDKSFFESATEDEIIEKMVLKCIDKVQETETEKMHDFQMATDEEKIKFLEEVDTKTYDAIREYLNNLPTLFHEIKYKNSKGTERTITLRTLNDFFTFV